MKTEEGNRLIADFMANPTVNSPHLRSDWELEYHRSWSSLMPVVEKIESMGYKTVIMKASCSIYNSQYNVDPFERATKIEAIYNHVIDFILWHNSTTPQTK